MTSQPLFDPSAGHSAAELLSPAYPERAARGTVPKLRAWQSEALAKYFETMPKDFLAAATPGAGKTTFALRLASEMLHRRRISRIIVVAPTEHLKTQWAEAAARASIRLDPYFKNADKRFGRHYQGIVVTYAQVAMKPELHRELVEEQDTLVILDEVHHGGDALSWGDGLREAYQLARHRLMLSGTPFRSDTAPIPFVSYAPDDKGIRTSITDYNYGYSRALADGVVRPVLFMVYNGNMRWRTKVGEEMSARLGEGNTKDITSQAWRTALDPQGDWIPAVLRAADRRLTEVRGTIPDAGGLVIATDQEVARAYATILEEITGERVTVVLSDEKEASERIEQFSAGGPAAAAGGPASRWMVAVRMVSEGVDIPRLAVGVYATSASTPLFFAQAIGRFVRARRHGETASIFLPNVPSLMALASSMEVERDHALDRDTGDDDQGLDDGLIESANRTESASETMVDEFEWTALGSDATFDRVVFEGTEFGQEVPVASDEELDFIGIPGLLEPDQIQDLLRHRQRRQSKHASDRRRNEPAAEGAASEVPAPLHRTLKEQRKLLNQLVSLWASSTNRPHGMIHAELRSACGGPAVAQASVTQLQARIVMVRAWMKS